MFEIAVADGALNGLFLVFLYVSVGGLACRWLVPRLSPSARLLAAVMLAAQIFVIVRSQTIDPATHFEGLLWELRHEWNIPTTLSFAQLATVGALGILLGWIAREKPGWNRLYLAAMGLIFLFLSIDEYFKVHEPIEFWYLIYAAAGAIVALVTALVTARSLRQSRIWYVCLLGGLALSAAGGILFERLNRACDSLAFLRFDGCFHLFVWEEASELLGIWLALVAMLGLFSELRPAAPRLARRVILFLPLIALLMLTMNAMLPGLELPLLAQPAAVEFESDVRLRGFRLDQHGAHGQRISARLYLSAKQKRYLWLGYSIHLLDQSSGESVAGGDAWVDRQHGVWLLGRNHEQVYRQMLAVDMPQETPANRALWIVLTLWRPQDEEYVEQVIRASDHRLLSDTQVVLGEAVLRKTAAAAPLTKPLADFDNGFALSLVKLPTQALASEPLTLTFGWRANAPGEADWMQFLHFQHQESGGSWAFDQQPLGDRLPTRLWYDGLADSETWTVSLPEDLPAGDYQVLTGLYRLGDQTRLIARDASGNPFTDSAVPLGNLFILNPNSE